MNYLLVIRLSPMHAFFEVTDGDGQPAYRSSTRLMSLTDKAVITDGADQVVAHFCCRLISMRGVHRIIMADGGQMTVRTDLRRADETVTIPENGWQICGNRACQRYRILDEGQNLLAEVYRPWGTMRDRCRIAVADQENADRLISLVIVLEHTAVARSQVRESAAHFAGPRFEPLPPPYSSPRG